MKMNSFNLSRYFILIAIYSCTLVYLCANHRYLYSQNSERTYIKCDSLIEKKAISCFDLYKFYIGFSDQILGPDRNSKVKFKELFYPEATHYIDFNSPPQAMDIPIKDYIDSLIRIFNGIYIYEIDLDSISCYNNEATIYFTKKINNERIPDNCPKEVSLRMDLEYTNEKTKIIRVEKWKVANDHFSKEESLLNNKEDVNCDGEILCAILDERGLDDLLQRYNIAKKNTSNKNQNIYGLDWYFGDTISLCLPKNNIFEYVVKNNDTFHKIFKENVDMEEFSYTSDFAVWNKSIKNPNKINFGDTIYLVKIFDPNGENNLQKIDNPTISSNKNDENQIIPTSVINEDKSNIFRSIQIIVKPYNEEQPSELLKSPESRFIIKEIKKKLKFKIVDSPDEILEYDSNKGELKVNEKISINKITLSQSSFNSFAVGPLIKNYTNNTIEVPILLIVRPITFIVTDTNSKVLDNIEITVKCNNESVSKKKNDHFKLYKYPEIEYKFTFVKNFYKTKIITINSSSFPEGNSIQTEIEQVSVTINSKFSLKESYNFQTSPPVHCSQDFHINNTHHKESINDKCLDKQDFNWDFDPKPYDKYFNELLKDKVYENKTKELQVSVWVQTEPKEFGFNIENVFSVHELFIEILPFKANESTSKYLKPSDNSFNFSEMFSYPLDSKDNYPLKITINKPNGFNITSLDENDTLNWAGKVKDIELLPGIVSALKLTKTPIINFFYIDASAWDSKSNLVNFMKEEVSKVISSSEMFYIYISNGSKPMHSEKINSTDHEKLFNQLLFTKTYLPSSGEELKNLFLILNKIPGLSNRATFNMFFFLSKSNMSSIYPGIIEALKRKYKKINETIYTDFNLNTDIQYININTINKN